MAVGIRPERAIDVPHDAGVSARDAGARPRRDREHGVGGQQPEGRAKPLHLQRDQSRGDRHDQSVATDYVTAGHPLQLHLPRHGATPSLEERIAANAAQAGSVEAARAAFVERQPMGRLGTPEEIAALAVYLASDAAQFVTGQAVVIDGGLTL